MKSAKSAFVAMILLSTSSMAFAGIYPDPTPTAGPASTIESFVSDAQTSTTLRIGGEAARDLYNLLATGQANQAASVGHVSGRGIECDELVAATGHYPSAPTAVRYECRIIVGARGVK